MVDEIHVKERGVIRGRHNIHAMQGNSAWGEPGKGEAVDGIGMRVVSSHIVQIRPARCIESNEKGRPVYAIMWSRACEINEAGGLMKHEFCNAKVSCTEGRVGGVTYSHKPGVGPLSCSCYSRQCRRFCRRQLQPRRVSGGCRMHPEARGRRPRR